ncbi:GerW family sporulation protein [uncultured Neglectibacter sp.]|uniref:GerW family sporulation protein n=1 Tax=uncultured Neglectibacter sp. TaxID=1924108 RepID=UPI0034DED45C
MSDNKVNNLMDVTMDKIKNMVDVNTIIGDPITTPDGTTVIPISRVSYGFASGGSDLPSKAQPASGLFAGGSGAGITIIPIAFLAISHGNVRVLQIEPYMGPVDRALEKIPEMVDKITALFHKDSREEASSETAPSQPVETKPAITEPVETPLPDTGNA